MSLLCRDIPDQANAFIDREAAPIDYLKVAAHLSVCRDCRSYVRSLKVTRQLARSSLRREPPAELKLRLGLAGEPGVIRNEDGTP